MAVVPETEEVELQRERLLARLAWQRNRLSELWDWYRGRQAVPDVPAKYRPAYQLMLDSSVTPWARLVVDAIAERLRVQGVRAEDDADAAGEAWDAFKRCRLDADQRLIYVEALIGGTGYVSVAAQENERDVGIRPESAFEVTHEAVPSDRQRVAAALKLYPLDWSREDWVCELYRPEASYRWVAQAEAPKAVGLFPIDSKRRSARRQLVWEPLEPYPNDTGVVPIVPFENRMDVLSGGASEIEDCIPILQRLDRLTLDMMVASHFGAFRQKWATGLQVPTDPDTGKNVEPYRAAVDRLWTSRNADSRFGTFDATDLSGYLSAVDSEVAKLASISRVPAHYLMQRSLANPPTAESLIASETGLTSKVEDRHAQYGEAWEQAFWLHAQLSGEREVDLEEFEVQWQSAEKRNPAQVADAAVKWQAMGVPRPALWQYGGFTPQQIDEWTQEGAAQQLLALAGLQQQPALPTEIPEPEVPVPGA